MGDRRAAYATLLAGMVAFGGTWPAGKVAADHVPPAVIAVARFASAAVLLWLWGRELGAARASSFALLVPIFGVLSSVVVLHEPLRATLAVGGAIVVLGLWLAESRRELSVNS